MQPSAWHRPLWLVQSRTLLAKFLRSNPHHGMPFTNLQLLTWPVLGEYESTIHRSTADGLDLWKTLHLVGWVVTINQNTQFQTRLYLRLLQPISPISALTKSSFLTKSFNIFILFWSSFPRSQILNFSKYFLCLAKPQHKPVSLLEQHNCKYGNMNELRQCKSHVGL